MGKNVDKEVRLTVATADNVILVPSQLFSIWALPLPYFNVTELNQRLIDADSPGNADILVIKEFESPRLSNRRICWHCVISWCLKLNLLLPDVSMESRDTTYLCLCKSFIMRLMKQLACFLSLVRLNNPSRWCNNRWAHHVFLWHHKTKTCLESVIIRRRIFFLLVYRHSPPKFNELNAWITLVWIGWICKLRASNWTEQLLDRTRHGSRSASTTMWPAGQLSDKMFWSGSTNNRMPPLGFPLHRNIKKQFAKDIIQRNWPKILRDVMHSATKSSS